MFRAVLAVALALGLQPDQEAMVVAGTRALVDAMFSGRPGPLAAKFDERMKAALPDAQLAAAVATVVAQAGEFRGISGTRASLREGIRVVVVTCDFAHTPVDVSVAWNGSLVVGLNMRPAPVVTAYHPPDYVQMPRFTEVAVTVDAGGGWPLPGTISMPAGDGPFPAVVLVHGSGPGDRDESVGPNRPFRDLAWGLASRGIAVLRYDKRTLAHRARVAGLTTFTVKDETIDDALAGAALLRATPGIRKDRVFVLGHSLGGMLAPRIGAADPSLAGLIVLAGAVRPLEDAILAQTRYLAGLDGTISEAERGQIAEAEALVQRARSLHPGDPPLTGALAAGPASYVIDLRGYHPPTAARALALPMLVLQGERDYQVTMDDFGAWRAALGGRRDVRLTSYPRLNHLFIAGTGASSPAEYHVEGHVDGQVVADIAGWVLAQGAAPAPRVR
ncbi:MAG: alpha/beta fold hydrolase [Vicinamibacterales bacterium]